MVHKHRTGYILHNHHDGAVKSGLTSEQMQELQKPGHAPAHFSPRQLSILALVDAAGLPAEADGALVREAKSHLSDAEIIEVFGRDRPCLHRLLHHRCAGYRTGRRALQAYGCSEVRTQSVKRAFAVEAIIIPRWTYWQSISRQKPIRR
jgi:hypothetical protein